MSAPYHQILTEAATPKASVTSRFNSENGEDLLKETLAALRALSWLFQTLHWQVQGPNFYERHLLFERLYNNLNEEIDVLAEKIVGSYGSMAVERENSLSRVQKWLKEWKDQNAISVAIRAEQEFQALLKLTYNTLKEADELTLGMDDFLMSTASAHETNLYLLGQMK